MASKMYTRKGHPLPKTNISVKFSNEVSDANYSGNRTKTHRTTSHQQATSSTPQRENTLTAIAIGGPVQLPPVTSQSQKTREALRSRRWSNPDVSSLANDVQCNGKPKDQTATKSFSQYDFYVNRVGENTASLNDFDKKRGKTSWHGESISVLSFQRNQYATSYSTEKATQRLKLWAEHAYKDRLKEALRREYKPSTRVGSPNSEGSEDEEALESIAPLRQSLNIVNNKTGPGRKSSIVWTPHEHTRIVRPNTLNFRWNARMIRSICRLAIDMKKLSVSRTQQSTYSDMLYILAGATTHAGQQGEGDEGNKLLFDKSWFNRNRARSRMPTWAVALMAMPPTMRPTEQMSHLKQLLLTMKAFRENMTDDMRTKICQVVRYTKCDKGRVVLRQGHVGFDFYFIFSGSVFIQIDVYDPKTEETNPSVENVLRTGEGFGEIALLGDGKRTASVICKEPTELCQMDKDTFLQVCPAMFEELLSEKIKFAQQFPIFKILEPEVLHKLCFLSQILEIPHSTVIERSWADTNYAYFVMKGRMSTLKEFDVTDIVDKMADTRCLYDDDDGQPRVLKMTRSANAHRDKKQLHTRYAHVGLLYEGNHSDLSVLAAEPRKNIPNITLVSEGVRLFRVAARTFVRMSPRKPVEEYLKKVYKPPTFPRDEELYTHYLKSLRWTHFKTNMLQTCTPQDPPYMSATVPATMKGSTGWARWPGFVIRKKQKQSTSSIDLVADAQFGPGSTTPHVESTTEDDSTDDDTDTWLTEKNEVDLFSRRRDSRYFDQSVLEEMDTKTKRITSDHSMTLSPPSVLGLGHNRQHLPEVV